MIDLILALGFTVAFVVCVIGALALGEAHTMTGRWSVREAWRTLTTILTDN